MKTTVNKLLRAIKQVFGSGNGQAIGKRRNKEESPAYIEDFVLSVTLVIERLNKGKINTLKAYEQLLKAFLQHHKIR